MNNPYMMFVIGGGVVLMLLRSGASQTHKPARFVFALSIMTAIALVQLVYWLAFGEEGKVYYEFMWGHEKGSTPWDSVWRHSIFLLAIVLQFKMVKKMNLRWMEINPNVVGKVKLSPLFEYAFYPVFAMFMLLFLASVVESVFNIRLITKVMADIYIKVIVGVGVAGALYGLYMTFKENISSTGSNAKGIAITLFLFFYYGTIVFSIYSILLSIVVAWVSVILTIFGGKIAAKSMRGYMSGVY